MSSTSGVQALRPRHFERTAIDSQVQWYGSVNFRAAAVPSV